MSRQSKTKHGGSVEEPENKDLVGIGDIAPDFQLCDDEGKTYKLSSFRGRRVILSFQRYAACPICQFNIDRMKYQSEMLDRAGIVTISIFNSKPQHVTMFTAKIRGDSMIALSDKKGSTYSSFQVKQGSFWGVLRSNLYLARNWKKYKPFAKYVVFKDTGANTTIMKQLPADFMIDESGVIVDLFRARNVQDHISFERVEAFIPEDKRCRCNKKDCISSTCREKYEEIKRIASEGIFVG